VSERSTVLDQIRLAVRKIMHMLARGLNTVSGGRLSPNSITITGLLAHIPIAFLIASSHPLWAALLLVIFGLFDTLDGELARQQHRDNAAGMLLDASTDRMKEVMLYAGAAYYFVATGHPYGSVWAVIALGASLCVSYVKAKGETAIAKSGLSASEVNQLFADGLMRFEVRMALLVLGLLTGWLLAAVVVIAILSIVTALQRLFLITNRLANDKS